VEGREAEEWNRERASMNANGFADLGVIERASKLPRRYGTGQKRRFTQTGKHAFEP
jgi:hypothetical protein